MGDKRESEISAPRATAVVPVSGGASPDALRAAGAGNSNDVTMRKLFGGAMECLLPSAYADVSDLRQVPDHQEAFVSREDGVSIVIEVLSFEPDLPSDGGDGASARYFFDDLAAANGASSSECDFCADLTDRIMPKLPSFAKASLAGRQAVAKFRGDGPLEAVRVYLVNVRLPNVDSDLLITVNVPYPDECSAANSSATAECFTGSQSKKAFMPGELRNLQTSPDGCDKAPVVGVAIDTEDDDECVAHGDVVVEEGGTVGESSEEVLAKLSKASTDTGEIVEGSEGVAALQSILRSFAILDWSLFC